MTDETEQKTLQDLFRVMNDMRGEMNARFDSVEGKVDVGFADLNGQTQAIREVVDTLASQEDFAELDRKIASVAVDTKATRTDVNNLKAEVSRLKSAVKNAGIPVR
ncbi:MAG: hypothetical protein ACR2RF_20600 [Geminicoccaceae bacterium]